MDDTPTSGPQQPSEPPGVPPSGPSMMPVPEAGPTPLTPQAPPPADAFSQMPPPPPMGGIPSRSGPIPLKPMGVGEILDVAIRVYKANWKPLMTMVAVVIVPFTLLQNFVTNGIGHPFVADGRLLVPESNYDAYRVAIIIFAVLSFLVIVPFLRGAVARAVGGIYLGEQPSARGCLEFARARLGALLVGVLLSSLLMVAGFFALVIPGLILFVRYTFVTPSIVVEGVGGSASLSRSWELSKGNGWRIFGTLIVSTIIAAIIAAIISIPLQLLALTSGGSIGWVIRAAAASVVSIITTPFLVTVAVLLYFDSRIRNEAFDLSVMAREVGQTPS
jgi:hypothetical protein